MAERNRPLYNQTFTDEKEAYSGLNEIHNQEGGKFMDDTDTDTDDDIGGLDDDDFRIDPSVRAEILKQASALTHANQLDHARRMEMKQKQEEEQRWIEGERTRRLKEKEDNKVAKKKEEREALKAELRNRRDALIGMASMSISDKGAKAEIMKDPPPKRKAPPPKPQARPNLANRPAMPSRPIPTREEVKEQGKITTLTTRKRAVRSDKGKKHNWSDGRETTATYKANEGTDWSKLRGKANKRKCEKTGKWVAC